LDVLAYCSWDDSYVIMCTVVVAAMLEEEQYNVINFGQTMLSICYAFKYALDFRSNSLLFTFNTPSM